MKKLLLLLATMFTLTAKSQTSVYHPFPDSNAVWTEETHSWAPCPWPPYTVLLIDGHFSNYLQGDTLANGFIYHKMYLSGVSHLYCTSSSISNWSSGNGYAYAYRQDTAAKKIFLWDGTESLLYDFSLNVGDTVPRGFSIINSWDTCAVVITSIDSILIGNNYRKRFNLSAPMSFFPIIEGIGSTVGLREPLCPFEHASELICFSQNGQTLYPDTNSACAIVTNDNEIQDNSSINVFPNPFSKELNFTSNNQGHSEIILYDITSRELLQKKFTNSVTLNTEQLAKGIYIYEVRNKNGPDSYREIKKGKVVKD